MTDERGGAVGRDARRWSDEMRRALAEIEEQRDDTVAYLSTIRAVLDIVGHGHGMRECGQETAEVLLRQLAVETCAIALRREGDDALELAGFATQGQWLGGPRDAMGESGWLALARLVGSGADATCFRRAADGGFTAVTAAELVGDGYLVLPLSLGGESGGAVVLHALVGPAQVFARGRALGLVGEIVGQALTMARMRDSLQRVCGDLEGELGVTRRALSAQQETLTSHEENVQKLTQALIRSNRVKRDFLGTVSHELRTPLNAILGYSALVRDGVAGSINAEQTKLLDRVIGNTRHLNMLIDDILFFVQLEADRVLVRPERVDMGELIEEVVSSLPPHAGRARIDFTVDLSPDAATMHVDPTLVRRCLFHLLGNAFKFTAEGEVRLTVAPGDDDGVVIIAVRDTGVGMPAERIEELFEIFSQGDGSTTRRYNGLGMGLTLVDRCVRLLGGEIGVDSRPGVGSEFRIALPNVLGTAAREPVAQATDTVH